MQPCPENLATEQRYYATTILPCPKRQAKTSILHSVFAILLYLLWESSTSSARDNLVAIKLLWLTKKPNCHLELRQSNWCLAEYPSMEPGPAFLDQARVKGDYTRHC